MDDPHGDCPRCRALEARIADLERRLAGRPEAELPPFELRALRLLDHGWGEGWELRPSPLRRAWMDAAPHAYHCLPLVVANQWGWQVLCPTDVAVTWDGHDSTAALAIELADPRFAPAILSRFGRGIVTFSPPWLFRTPPGWDLLVKGPGNRWKPNAAPLEGVVETWWLPYTFTFNWKLIEPGTVRFARGESLAQLVPVPHATFRGATATEQPIGRAEPETAEELLRWLHERRRRTEADPGALHRLYRRAEEVEDHLVRVPVPPVEPG